MNYYNILLPTPSRSGIYVYSSDGDIKIGSRVVVDFNKRTVTGIVLSTVEKPTFNCKDIAMLYDEQPLFNEKYLTFLKRLADYYYAPLGLTLYGVMSEKLLNLESADDIILEKVPVENIELTDEQNRVITDISLNKFSPTLLYGITGSGKTEVYLEIAKKILALNKQVIYIVPEISLTPQLIDRIGKRLGVKPISFHSKLTDKQRSSAFFALANNRTNFIIGARSALFLPAKNLGLIIIDEEHEASYKQDDAPAYNLRDMAVLYASILEIPIILGSATPSVESIYNVKRKKYLLEKLIDRPKKAILPEINIIDQKKHELIGGVISEPIFDKLSETISRGEQAIIFLNRKGYSTALYCKTCGAVLECQNCSIPVVYYKFKNIASCKYCNTDYKYLKCKTCEGREFNEYGIGTEKLEEVLENIFPNDILRMDMENITTYDKLKKGLKIFEERKKKILIGTQLVSKGLHFPSVTLVIILGIDNILAMPDFRSSERAFQQLVQVSGRAGREALKGEVYIQTLNPESHIFTFLMKHTERFFDYELQRRNESDYPPYSKLVRLIFIHSNSEKIWNIAKDVASKLRTDVENIIILGPAEDKIYMMKKKFRVAILLKSKNSKALSFAVKISKEMFEKNKSGAMILKIDKDPYRL